MPTNAIIKASDFVVDDDAVCLADNTKQHIKPSLG